ncbi:hypothetical protein E2C01_021437 [Portunus trituberculatus]|uniref:Uncharacterized protein n=1 Tax=Portunus trituberculatus TaxID=210409 RepID=A0A5B7E493_PORTR|nr:hypothetical protein [Portunus trituberculatus]
MTTVTMNLLHADASTGQVLPRRVQVVGRWLLLYLRVSKIDRANGSTSTLTETPAVHGAGRLFPICLRGVSLLPGINLFIKMDG